MRFAALRLAIIGATAFAGAAAAQTPINFIFPAPPTVPAFVPHVLALNKGYFKERGLDVRYTSGQGGTDVAVQVGAGNADFGNGIGDVAMIVRQNGVPVKKVALLGGGGLHQIFIREDSGIKDPAGLKGQPIAVMAYQDTSYYALLGVLGKFGLTKNDVQAQAVGYAGVPQLVIGGRAVAIAGVIDWAVQVEGAGIKLRWLPIRDYFPSMAQVVLASDKMIAERPQVVQSMVDAMIKALSDVMADPAKAARDYVSFVPAMAGREAQMIALVEAYNKYVYAGQAKVGQIDPSRLKELQDFYLKEGVIRTAVPIEQTYTNQFIR